MIGILHSFASCFQEYAVAEFVKSPDFIGDILSRFNGRQKAQLRAEIIEFLALDDEILLSAFNELGASWYVSEPSQLRALFGNIIDRIDGRDAVIATLTPSE